MITQRPLYLAILVLTVSCAFTNYAAAQSDACAEGYVWREAFEGDHVCVSPGTREQAQADNALAAQRRATAKAAVPLPPARLGCHVFRAGEWREVPCATEEETKRMRRPEVAIESRFRVVSTSFGNMPFRATLEAAKIDIDLLSDPVVGSVNDARLAGCHGPNDPAKNTPDSFSVQVNTNYFNASFGGRGWVQFVLQTPAWDGSDKDGLCVWKVDVTAQGYDNSACQLIGRDGTFLGPAARGGTLTVRGFIQRKPEDATHYLTAMLTSPWALRNNGNGFAITTTDTINGKYRGLDPKTEYPLGLSLGNWWQASGDLYGTGCRSTAQFKGTRFWETLTVFSCNPEDPSCLSAPMTPFSLPYYAVGLFSFPAVTGETNNLRSSRNTYQSFGCGPYSTQCLTWGGSHSPDQ